MLGGILEAYSAHAALDERYKQTIEQEKQTIIAQEQRDITKKLAAQNALILVIILSFPRRRQTS